MILTRCSNDWYQSMVISTTVAISVIMQLYFMPRMCHRQVKKGYVLTSVNHHVRNPVAPQFRVWCAKCWGFGMEPNTPDFAWQRSHPRVSKYWQRRHTQGSKQDILFMQPFMGTLCGRSVASAKSDLQSLTFVPVIYAVPYYISDGNLLLSYIVIIQTTVMQCLWKQH